MKKMICTSMDAIMYTMMNYIQWQLRHEVSSRARLEAYLETYASWDRPSYFSIATMKNLEQRSDVISWETLQPTPFVENRRARAHLFFATSKKKAPTLIILHSLMSASDRGYRRIAAAKNREGWNVFFPHLPFHYSRVPQYHTNGALAITTDLVRTAETVRQAVKEIRQLVAWTRDQGISKIAILATSYGAWIGSLLLSLEQIDFAILLQPIINLGVAAFHTPLASVMGSILQAHGINEEHFQRHAHLTGAAHAKPLLAPKQITIIGGKYDQMAPPKQLRSFASSWGASYEEAEQGHFGYQAMKLAQQLSCLRSG